MAAIDATERLKRQLAEPLAELDRCERTSEPRAAGTATENRRRLEDGNRPARRTA
jgi:hypothetical protein